MHNLKIYHIGLSATPGTNNGLQRAFKKVSEYKEIYTGEKNLNRRIIEEVKSFKPDLVFIQVQTPDIIFIETLREIRSYCGKIINFTGDVRSPLPSWYLETGKEIDLSLFVSMEDVLTSRANGINADWIQLGFDDSIFCKEGIKMEVPEIIFLANNYGNFPLSKYRYEIVSELKKEFKERFEVFGVGWAFETKNINPSLEEQAAAYRGCKIAINCSHFNQSMYTSDRMLRIMGSGAFCLSHNFTDYHKVYKNGEHLAIFNSIPEMINLCYEFLEKEEDRKIIADNGNKLTHKLYTWDCMINNLIKL